MKLIRTWEEAKSILATLVFNLGLSSSAIKEIMEEGFMIEYDSSLNVYYFIQA